MAPISQRQSALLDWFRDFDSCLVAFSGGLDSSVVAKAAALALGEQALAVMAESPSSFRNEIEEARSVAEAIPIRFLVFSSPEMDDACYVANDRDRCYYCKKIRFRELRRYADRHEIALLVDGSNRDDMDDYRPGRRAVEEFGFRSPLAELGFDKQTVRTIARAWKLPNAEKPASPCLSTRISYGLEITEGRLRKIEAAEVFLYSLGFSTLRVRLHPDELARIEVAAEEIHRLAEPALRGHVIEKFKELGFEFVSLDLQGFRSGSMNPARPGF